MDIRLEKGTWNEAADEAFERATARLSATLDRYGIDDGGLVASFKPRGDVVAARVELVLPEEILTAERIGVDAESAVRRVFDLLQRRFEAYRIKVDPGSWRPLAMREDVRAEEATRRQWRAHVLRRALPVLHRVAEQAIALRVTDGDLPGGHLEADDLVDDVVTANLAVIDQAEDVDQATWHLIDSVWDGVDAQVEALAGSGEEISLETRLPLDNLVEDQQVVWNTADQLWLDDVLGSDDELDPDAVVAEREHRDRLVRALFLLPDELRLVFTQAVLDNWSSGTVAAAWRRGEGDVRADIAEAARRLGRALSTSGLSPEDAIALYRALGARLHDERKKDEITVASGRTA